jgi:hypothetical protein
MSALPKVAFGLDLGDRLSVYAVLDTRGRVTARGRVPADRVGSTGVVAEVPPARVELEVSRRSPWISRLITGTGHAPIVANARKVNAVTRMQPSHGPASDPWRERPGAVPSPASPRPRL